MHALRVLIDLIFPPRATALRARESSLESLGILASPETLPGQFDTVALLPYKNPEVRSLIIEAKFHEETRAHAILGRLLAEYLRDLDSDAFERRATCIIPIPLSKARYRARGYNQAERIAREAMKTLDESFVLAPHLMRRVRDTRPQTSLTRTERTQNMKDAFTVSGLTQPDWTYIVVDDVTTTGATLTAAGEALQLAGASQVHLVALAH